MVIFSVVPSNSPRSLCESQPDPVSLSFVANDGIRELKQRRFCFDANKFVLLSFFSLIKTIYPRVSTKPLPNDAKSPLPVDARYSKTLFPIYLTRSRHVIQ